MNIRPPTPPMFFLEFDAAKYSSQMFEPAVQPPGRLARGTLTYWLCTGATTTVRVLMDGSVFSFRVEAFDSRTVPLGGFVDVHRGSDGKQRVSLVAARPGTAASLFDAAMRVPGVASCDVHLTAPGAVSVLYIGIAEPFEVYAAVEAVMPIGCMLVVEREPGMTRDEMASQLRLACGGAGA